MHSGGLTGDDFYPLRKCEHEGGCVGMAVKADDAAADGRARCWFHGPDAPTGPSDGAFDEDAWRDREPRIVRAGDEGWVRHGRELYEGDAPGRTRTPRDPR